MLSFEGAAGLQLIAGIFRPVTSRRVAVSFSAESARLDGLARADNLRAPAFSPKAKNKASDPCDWLRVHGCHARQVWGSGHVCPVAESGSQSHVKAQQDTGSVMLVEARPASSAQSERIRGRCVPTSVGKQHSEMVPRRMHASN